MQKPSRKRQAPASEGARDHDRVRLGSTLVPRRHRAARKRRSPNRSGVCMPEGLMVTGDVEAHSAFGVVSRPPELRPRHSRRTVRQLVDCEVRWETKDRPTGFFYPNAPIGSSRVASVSRRSRTLIAPLRQTPRSDRGGRHSGQMPRSTLGATASHADRSFEVLSSEGPRLCSACDFPG